MSNNHPDMPDMSSILKMAQKMAQEITPPDDLNNAKDLSDVDMSKLLSNITQQVVSKVPEMMTTITDDNTVKDISSTVNKAPGKSMISFNEDINDKKPKKEKKKRLAEIESDESSETEEDIYLKRTKDMHIQLLVSLEDLYKGSKKKIAVRRNKINPDGSSEEEKKKFTIKIDKGMIDEQEIRFNHAADEKSGYETGDVVIHLELEDHKHYIRDGNNLLMEKEISFAETFNPMFILEHINGKKYKIIGDAVDPFNNEDELKKINGYGMPILGEDNKFGDLFIKFSFSNNVVPTEEQLKTLYEIFPSKNIISKDLNDIECLKFEMVTDSDLEFLDDSDYTSSEYSESSGDESK